MMKAERVLIFYKYKKSTLNTIIFAATALELQAAEAAMAAWRHQYPQTPLQIRGVVSGIGATATAYHCTRAFLQAPEPIDLAINIGIAGTFWPDRPLGAVYRLRGDYFGDLGIQTARGFESLFDADILDAYTFPFRGGMLTPAPLQPEQEAALAEIPCATGVTVQRIVEENTSESHPFPGPVTDVETMEGAAFFYVCLCEKIPCLSLRAISNRVGERDKSKWNIPLALQQLEATLKNLSPLVINP